VGTSEEPRARRRDRLALTALFAAALAASCGGGAQDDLDELRRDAPPDVYYLGESFEGEELSHVDGGRRFFVYGTCDPGPETGCAPPIQIQHRAFVAREWALAAGCMPAGSIRGVPAVHHDSLIVLTRGSFVKIYATSDAQTRRAFEALRSLDGSVGAGDSLPPAAPRVIRAVLDGCSRRVGR
jgi:hypothetical protein